MPLSIKSPKADRLARELAALTGESITDAVVAALESHLKSETSKRSNQGLDDIIERFAQLEVLDERDPDSILGYDQFGLPQ